MEILQGITEPILEQNDENIYDLYKKIGSIRRKKKFNPLHIKEYANFYFF